MNIAILRGRLTADPELKAVQIVLSVNDLQDKKPVDEKTRNSAEDRSDQNDADIDLAEEFSYDFFKSEFFSGHSFLHFQESDA